VLGRHGLADYRAVVVAQSNAEVSLTDCLRATWGPGRRWTPGEAAWAVTTDRQTHRVESLGAGVCWLRPHDVVIVSTTIEEANDGLRLARLSPVQISAADETLRSAADRAGWRPLVGASFDLDLRLGVAYARPPALPAGYRIRSVMAADDLVGIHRASWSPPQLPFAGKSRPAIDPDATSSFDALLLDAVQAAGGYELAAHLVAEAPNGALAASCIAWHDPKIDITSIEPLGVDPVHRRLGLAGALALAVADQARDRGIAEVVIHPRGDAAYPAPRRAYRRVGFVAVDRTDLFVAPR